MTHTVRTFTNDLWHVVSLLFSEPIFRPKPISSAGVGGILQ